MTPIYSIYFSTKINTGLKIYRHAAGNVQARRAQARRRPYNLCIRVDWPALFYLVGIFHSQLSLGQKCGLFHIFCKTRRTSGLLMVGTRQLDMAVQCHLHSTFPLDRARKPPGLRWAGAHQLGTLYSLHPDCGFEQYSVGTCPSHRANSHLCICRNYPQRIFWRKKLNGTNLLNHFPILRPLS